MASLDSHLAPRRCLEEPIPEIFEAASLLSDAVDAHLAGDRQRADRLIPTGKVNLQAREGALHAAFTPPSPQQA